MAANVPQDQRDQNDEKGDRDDPCGRHSGFSGSGSPICFCSYMLPICSTSDFGIM
jgi:hypothetical protein